MGKGIVGLDFKLKKIDETRNSILKEIKDNDLMSEKLKKMCRLLNGFEYFLIFVSAVSASISVSISVFASLVGIPVSIASFAVGLKVCTLIAGIENY